MGEKGYCVKCKESREMKDEQKVVMKNGRNAMKGKCPTCGDPWSGRTCRCCAILEELEIR